ncbi:MAG: hypothetical protein HY652_00505 [Acidobacteria bacterium]|nr:hypothetical protein [Acidobacteriota bacterium]
MPGGYEIPKYVTPARIRPVQAPAVLLPAVRNCVKNWVLTTSPRSILLVSDSSVPPVVEQAFERALREAGLVTLKKISVSLPAGGAPAMYSADWWGGEIWREVARADVTLALSYVNPRAVMIDGVGLEQFLSENRSRMIRVNSKPELLASDWGLFPRDLFGKIAEALAEQIQRGLLLKLQDGAGTSLTASYEPGQVARFQPESPLLSFPPQGEISVRPQLQGIAHVKSHSSTLGFLPLLHLTQDSGRIRAWEGGGSLGEYFRKLSHDSGFGVAAIGLGLNPQAFRYTEGASLSPELYGQEAGAQRAGSATFHFAGQGGAGPAVPFFDLQVFYPDVYIDDEQIIREGYPLVLDSASVRQMASLYSPGLLKVQCAVATEITPKSPKVAPVTDRAAVAAAARTFLTNFESGLKAKKGIILTDASVSKIAEEGISDALKDFGDYQIRRLEDLPAPGDPVAALKWSNAPPWSPDLRRELQDADVIMNLSFSNLVTGRISDLPRKKIINWLAVPEVLASFWNAVPPRALQAIWNREFEIISRSPTISVVDQRGTSLMLPNVKPVPEFSSYAQTLLYAPASSFIAVQSQDSSGVVVASRLGIGEVEPLSLKIDKGTVTSIEGSGPAADYLRNLASQGVAFHLAEVRWYHHPKAFAYRGETSGYSTDLWGTYAGNLRAGILHVLFRDPGSGFLFETISYFSTVLAIGASSVDDLITDGMLQSLGIDAVRKTVSDSKLLELEWIPEVQAGKNN